MLQAGKQGVPIKVQKLELTAGKLFLKMGSFSLLCRFCTVNRSFMFNKNCQWRDSNPGRLVTEATGLPTVPQPLPLLTR